MNGIGYLRILKKLWPYLWVKENKIRLRIIASFIFMLLRIVTSLGTLIVLKKVINILSNGNLNEAGSIIYFWLFVYGFLWIVSAVCNQLKTAIMFRVLEYSERLLGIKIFDHLLSLSLRFHIERRTGAITNAITHAQHGFDNIFWGLFLFAIPTIGEIILALVLLSYLYGFIYSCTLISILIIYFMLTYFGIEWSVKAQDEYIKKDAQASSQIVDSLLNFETVKYFVNEKYEVAQCDNILKQREDAVVTRYLREEILIIGQWIVVGIGLTLLTIVSGTAVLNGKITVGDFVLINGYILQFAAPLNHFGYILRQIRKGLTDMEQYLRLLEQKPEVIDEPDALKISFKDAQISFENVTFAYNPERTILKNISFNIPAGKTVAIVGHTGSGKSTLSRLLFRFYNLNSGKITINNVDISKVSQESLHKAIGIVPQDTVLFNNSLYYNIAYAKPDATRDEIEQAAKVAHLDTFINSLPQGYDTIVGERGLKLSGGEKQRIAIARVVLKKPKIYIFDEATSALDTHTEREIQKNLEEISFGATTLIIAHRLSTIVHADNIIVLNEGTIAQEGSHNQLLKLNGIYTNLWNKQQFKQFANP